MKKYEVMYIINASVEEDKRAALINDLSKIITNQGGKVVKLFYRKPKGEKQHEPN